MNPVRLALACAMAFSCLLGTSRATTVIPPTLDELVERSASVIRTRVLETRCEWRGTGDNRHIVTVVTFAVDESIVGAAQDSVALEFLGGEIDGERMFVAGQPRFAPGHEDILFVSRQTKTISPLVRMMFGRYLVAEHEDGREFIARANGAPLLATDQVSAPLENPPEDEVLAMVLAAGPMTPDAFADAIRESARRQGRTDVSASTGGQEK